MDVAGALAGHFTQIMTIKAVVAKFAILIGSEKRVCSILEHTDSVLVP
jgi:hypothetical protein